MNQIFDYVKRFIQYIREQITKLPALWAMLRAYLQGLIAMLRLMAMAMAKGPVPIA